MACPHCPGLNGDGPMPLLRFRARISVHHLPARHSARAVRNAQDWAVAWLLEVLLIGCNGVAGRGRRCAV